MAGEPSGGECPENLPQLGEIKIDSAWGSFVDCTPDAVPVVSQVDGVDGLVLAAGCSGHGFGLGPGSAIWPQSLS